MMITEIEQRFKEVTELNEMDLTKYPIRKSDYKNQQQKTTKEAAKERGYITTPIFLVDTMIATLCKAAICSTATPIEGYRRSISVAPKTSCAASI